MQEKLHEAVKAKLTEQRKFVLWWDAQEKDRGGDAATHARRRSPTAVKAQDFGLDRDTIPRWRQLGYEDGGAFVTSIQSVFSEFRISIDQRKTLAKDLSQLASQRTVAKALGVGIATVNRDINDVPNGTPPPKKDTQKQDVEQETVPNETSAWFQDDADPSKLAKNRERQAKKREDTLRLGGTLPSKVEVDISTV